MISKILVAGAIFVSLLTTLEVVKSDTDPAVHSSSVDTLELASAPIKPVWILEGNPEARSHEHSASADLSASTAVWDSTAGTFRWYFGWDETVYILEGDVDVTDEDGKTIKLVKGDIAYFRGGTWVTWKIDHYVKKVAFMRRPLPKQTASLVYRFTDFIRRQLDKL